MPFILYEHSTSVCVIKVRLTMLEKGLDYEGRFVDLRRGGQFDPAYLRLNPGAVVPTLVHDGNALTESSVIQHYLDDVCPSPPLMPDEPLARYRVRRFMKTIDDPVHPACGVLTQGISFRKDFRDPDEIEARTARIPDPRRRERQRSALTMGLSSPFVADAARDFDSFLREMEEALADGPFLRGSAYSLADAAATPYVNRLEMLGICGVWSAFCPRVMDWYDRVRARPSFRDWRRAPLYGRRGRPRRGDPRALTRAGLREDGKAGARLSSAAAFRPFPEPARLVRPEPCGPPARPPFSAAGGLRQ